MKKIGLFLICILLVVALAIPAFAAGNTVFTVTANKSSVAKGEEVTFTVSISGENGLKTFGVAMDYDDDKFELVSHSPIITEWTAVYQPAVKMYAFMNMSSPPGAPAPVPAGKLFTFTLKAKVNCGTASAVSIAPRINVSGITSDMISTKGTSISFSGAHTYGDWAPDGDVNHVRTCSACGAKDTAPHDWKDGSVIKAPTCAEEGEKNQSCACGATKVASIPKNDDHAFDEGKVTTEPSCETKGVKTYTCTNGCGKTKTEDIAPTGHDFNEGEITTKPGCETKGVKTYTCKNGCGKTKTEDVAAIGHDYNEGEITTQPTCDTMGVKTYTCKNGCGVPKTEEVAALGHTPAADAEVTKKPTCEEPGVMTGKCGVCGAELNNQEIPALGHDYELTATVDPDCENAGSKTYVCKNDATHTYTETIAALGHSYGAWTKVDDEKHQRTCGTCGGVETADHNWNSGFVTVEPTCVDEGEKVYTCTDNCGAEYTEVMPATGIHEYDSYVDNLDDKTHTATCACGDVVTEDHDYSVNGDVIVKPTTSKEGQQEMLCACGAKTIKTLPKLPSGNKGELDDVSKTGDITGQIVVFAVAVAATMTAAGYGLKRKFVK